MRGLKRVLAGRFGGVVRGCVLAGVVAGLVLQGGAQATAPLLPPSAMVFDAQGNLYFAETGNHVIRKFAVSGILTTVAGSGVQGFAGDGGPAVAAELDSPAGVALDSAGNLYIADSHNHRVREVAAGTGAIATIAGTGVAGFLGDGGAAIAGRLDLPTALAVDAAGDVYVADTDNHRVRRIAAGTGVITTVAGDGVEGFAGDGGAATAASIDSPNGLALDAAGDLYLADTHNGRVREVSAATGLISTVAGVGISGGNVLEFGGDGGQAAAAGLALPRGITLDAAGNLYVADSGNQRVRKISAAGVITTVAGMGTEAFAGDGAPAVAARLDSPHSVAISPGGLLTLADSDNQRIRQLDALPAPGPDIHTIAGIGSGAPGTLSLTGPGVVGYGGGSVVATLTAATYATGSVTFADAITGGAVPLGSTALSADAASFGTGGLAAGAHRLIALYAGDATHAAAQSPALTMAITPLALVAAGDAASILYGQAVPALSGALSGVLAQDAGKVAAAFTTNAVGLSPVGVYPIAVALSGSAAGNYTVSLTPVSFTIAQASTRTALVASNSSPSAGLPVTFAMQAVSSTSGVPTGTVTLLDGASVLSVLALSGGSAAFNTSTLAPGTHSLSAVYSGDTNFLPGNSPAASVVVGSASDFTLAAVGPTSQAVPAGSAATFSFATGSVGVTLSSPITLAVQGVPAGAISSFSPNYLPPGGAVTSFTLTIQTPAAGVLWPDPPERPSRGSRAWLAILLLPAFGFGRRLRSWSWRGVALVLALGWVGLTTGCANRVNTGPESAGATSYTLTVTGTATSAAGTALQHSVSVALQVLQ